LEQLDVSTGLTSFTHDFVAPVQVGVKGVLLELFLQPEKMATLNMIEMIVVFIDLRF